MTAPFLFVLLIGYGVMAVGFLLAAMGSTKKSKWSGLVAIAFAAPFFFWLGASSERVITGECYFFSIGMIADAVDKTDDPASLARQIRLLSLHSYNTVCSQAESGRLGAALEKPPNAGAP